MDGLEKTLDIDLPTPEELIELEKFLEEVLETPTSTPELTPIPKPELEFSRLSLELNQDEVINTWSDRGSMYILEDQGKPNKISLRKSKIGKIKSSIISINKLLLKYFPKYFVKNRYRKPRKRPLKGSVNLYCYERLIE